MLIAERQQKILQIVEEKGGATVEELVQTLYASAPTIRRDLTAMEQNGLLKKVYGGAIPLTTAAREIPLSLRAQSQSSAKERMAERAAAMVQEGQLTDLSMEEVHLRQVMLQQAKKSVLLCDKSKFGKTYFYHLCHQNEIDEIISE